MGRGNSTWILSGCISPLFLPHLIAEFDVFQGFMAYKNDKLDLGSSQILGTLVWRMPPPREAWTGPQQYPEAPQSKENLSGREGASSCRECAQGSSHQWFEANTKFFQRARGKFCHLEELGWILGLSRAPGQDPNHPSFPKMPFKLQKGRNQTFIFKILFGVTQM